MWCIFFAYRLDTQRLSGFLNDSSRYDVENDYARWNRFRNFYQAQLDEVLQQFNPDCGGLMAIGNIVPNAGKQKKLEE